VLGATKQGQLEEVIRERGLDLWREHARGDARCAGREMAALDEADPRAARGEKIGNRAADDAAADDDDVAAAFPGGQRAAPTSPFTGLDGMATSLRGMRPAR